MHDIKAIRDNPQAFDAGLARRGLSGQSAALLAIDAQKRAVQNTLQDLLNRRNGLSKEVGDAMKKGFGTGLTAIPGLIEHHSHSQKGFGAASHRAWLASL